MLSKVLELVLVHAAAVAFAAAACLVVSRANHLYLRPRACTWVSRSHSIWRLRTTASAPGICYLCGIRALALHRAISALQGRQLEAGLGLGLGLCLLDLGHLRFSI